MVYLLKFIRRIILPPGGLLILLGVSGVLLFKGMKRTGRGLFISSLVLFYILSTDLGATFLILPLEKRYPPLEHVHFRRPYIVVLTGGAHRLNHLGLRPIASDSSLKRLIYGIRIFRASEDPILVIAGGRGSYEDPDVPESVILKRLVLDLGIAEEQVLYEDLSRDTWQNATEMKRLLTDHARPLVLVTSAFHMERAVRAFKKNGFHVIAAPTDYQSSPITINSFIPKAEAFEVSSRAFSEYLSLLWYLIRYF